MQGRDENLGKQLTAEQSKLHSLGVASSGRAVFAYNDIAAPELATRIGIAWSALVRAQRAFGEYSPSLADDLRLGLLSLIEVQKAVVHAAVMPRILINHTDIKAALSQALDAAESTQIARCTNEADYFAHDEQLRLTKQLPAGTTVNVQGSVGVLQTGTHSVAHVSINKGEAERLAKALDALRVSIESSKELGKEEQSQALNVVVQTRDAVATPTPNPSLVRGLIRSIGEMVHLAADIQPAWQAVHDAVVAIPGLFGS